MCGKNGQPTIPLKMFLPLWTLMGGVSSASPLRDTLILCPASLLGQTYAWQQGVPTLKQIHKLEVEGDAVLPSKDIDSAARC